MPFQNLPQGHGPGPSVCVHVRRASMRAKISSDSFTHSAHGIWLAPPGHPHGSNHSPTSPTPQMGDTL